MLKILLKRKLSKLKAFTISELLIALGVIAILTAILMPIVHSLVPDQNTLMAKRAFYTTETIIASMLNDDGCYPPIRIKVGLTDGTGYRKCSLWLNGKPDNANNKFVNIFTDKLDIKGSVNNGSTVTFETKDGMKWFFKSIGYSSNGNAVLTIDVNGESQGPNCGQNTNSGTCNPARDKGFDRFTMTIEPTGKIELQDCWAILAVRTDKKLVGKFAISKNASGECVETQE